MGHKTSRGSGGNFEKPPIGTKCPAVLAAYYPAGTHETNWQGTKKLQEKIILVWELDLNDSKGKPFRMFNVQTDSLFASARLKPIVEALLRRTLSDEEIEDGYDMDGVLGKCGMLYIDGDEKKGQAWVDKVDELQDANVRVAVRHEYDVLPLYVEKVLSSAEEGTAPGTFGAIIDGEVFFGTLPTKTERKNEDDGDDPAKSGETPF